MKHVRFISVQLDFTRYLEIHMEDNYNTRDCYEIYIESFGAADL